MNNSDAMSLVTYYFRKNDGLCVDCNNPSRPGKTRCQACANKRKVTDHEIKEFRKAHGLCRDCGQNDVASGKVLCVGCLEKSKARHEKCRKRRINHGNNEERKA